jgi:periplasmic protein TonB
MFDELPATNPSKDTRKPRAIAAATLIQAALVTVLILLQMAVPQRFGNFQMISGTSAAPPPPLGQAPQQQVDKSPKPSHKVEPHPVPAQPEPPKPEENTPEGVTNGHPEGVSGGIAGGEVGGTGDAVRVGGNIRQPEIIKLVKPVYPPEAIKARIEGVVVLEATVTERGDVADIKVISGPPTLIPAAIKAVEEWKYEPTLINGRPVSVILTAKVSFSLRHGG